jgi:hypothetical protein
MVLMPQTGEGYSKNEEKPYYCVLKWTTSLVCALYAHRVVTVPVMQIPGSGHSFACSTVSSRHHQFPGRAVVIFICTKSSLSGSASPYFVCRDPALPLQSGCVLLGNFPVLFRIVVGISRRVIARGGQFLLQQHIASQLFKKKPPRLANHC